MGACANVNAPAPGHDGGQERRRMAWRPKGPRNRTKQLHARWSWQRHLQEKASHRGLKAGITSCGDAVEQYERRVPPRLEGWGIHRG
jgi:hypothetical protein